MSKAAELAALIGSQSSLANRNMIINGNMEVAQRSTSVAVTASGYHTCDSGLYPYQVQEDLLCHKQVLPI